MFGPERADADAVELRRMYIDPTARRRGAARRMLNKTPISAVTSPWKSAKIKAFSCSPMPEGLVQVRPVRPSIGPKLAQKEPGRTGRIESPKQGANRLCL
jgi:hypothetical protein